MGLHIAAPVETGHSGGSVIVRGDVMIPEQAWYWTEEWQDRRREAEEDLSSGRYIDFASMDDFVASLGNGDPCLRVNSASGGETNEGSAESARVRV